MKPVVVIGAGVGGLAAAAALARQGLDVTVLEAHIYPGGCAGTFYHQGYRFDAGATLAAGFYPGGPMGLVARAAGLDAWPVYRPAEPAMLVHLPEGQAVPVGGEAGAQARCEAFGPQGEAFWRWQEEAADALWDLALRLPPWPPQAPGDLARLARIGSGWLVRRLPAAPGLLADALRPVSARLRRAPRHLRQLVDAQLLISAQATSPFANALYSAAALDLPRRGVVHLMGGMGSIAQSLARAVRRHGGRVLYRQQVTRIVRDGGRPVAVETRRGGSFPAGVVVANLPAWDLDRLLEGNAQDRVEASLPDALEDGWGAFVLYAGVDASIFPEGAPLHHQVVLREPLGEGNSVFLSISPAWDGSRAPAGRRAVTLSTHTELPAWWRLFRNDRPAYERRKREYQGRLLAAAERALPGFTRAVDLALPGTPVTFQRFTRRSWGWVGGFPQTGLLRAQGPRRGPGLWLVGDSIFPGQSTAAVALGGLRVAGGILIEKRFLGDRVEAKWNGWTEEA